MNLSIFSQYGIPFDNDLYYYFLCRRENKHFDVHLWRIRHVQVPPKDEKTRTMRGEMDGKSFVPRQSRQFKFLVNMIKVFFRICTLTWRVNI